MVEELFCSQCGKKNSPESEFCNYCGFKLTEGTPKKSINKKKKASESPSYENIVVIGYILSFLFLPAGLVIGMYLISQKSEYAKRHGWIIFGIAFTISFLIIVISLLSISGELSSIEDDLGTIIYRMGRMRVY